jgi:hypothetical protein
MSTNSTLIDLTSQSQDSTKTTSQPCPLNSRGSQTDTQSLQSEKPNFEPKRKKRKSTKTRGSKPETIRKEPNRAERLRVQRLDIIETNIDNISHAPIWTIPSMELLCPESKKHYARVYNEHKEILDATRFESDMAWEEKLNSRLFLTATEVPKGETTTYEVPAKLDAESTVCEHNPAVDPDSVTNADSETERCCVANHNVPSTWAYMSQPGMPRNVGSIAPPSLATQLHRKPLWDRAEDELEKAALKIDPTLKGKKLAAEMFRLSLLPLEQRPSALPPKHRPWTRRISKDAWSSFAPYDGRKSYVEEGDRRDSTTRMPSESEPDDLPTSVDITE